MAYARLVVALRWPILLAWIAGTAYVVVNVPEDFSRSLLRGDLFPLEYAITATVICVGRM